MRSIFLFFLCIQIASAQMLMEAPAGELPTSNRMNQLVIPNGRLLTPMGKHILTAPHPYGLVLSHDGRTAITANSGINPFSISIIKNIDHDSRVIQIPKGVQNDKGILEACFMGLATSPDDKRVYVAGGISNKILKYELSNGKPVGAINLSVKNNSEDYTHAYIGDMVMTRDGKFLYAVDQIGWRIVEIDLEKEMVTRNIPSGRFPFGITLSPDESKLIVANVGVFEYKRFTDLDPNNLKGTAHKYPSSKYMDKVMIEGDLAQGIPALGDPNSTEGFSVWIIDRVSSIVNSKVKTGFLVGQKMEDFPAVGGSSPNSVVATQDYVFVSNGNNDCVSMIHMNSGALIKNIMLNPEPRLKNLRGIIPFGLALSPDQKRVYVACAGINSVAAIDIASQNLIGHLPTAWFPSKLKVTPDGKKLVVSNAKGLGSGPNGGKDFIIGDEGSYIGSLMKGIVSIIDIPKDEEWKSLTKKVIDNNFKFIAPVSGTKNLIPAASLQKSNEIKYIVYIAKENRTYDEVFGQLSNGNGDASLARFGEKVEVNNKDRTAPLSKVDVMPNHLALARRFSISDNFYCDSDVSADGHRWMVNTYPNEWCETQTAATYGGKLYQIDTSQAPGNLAIYGAAGSIYPEDFNEGGSLWEHLERNKIEFFNFGFGVEMAAAYSDSTMKYIGELYTVNYPLPAPLYDRSSKIFPTYNMAISDQFRVDLFIKEFNEKWSNGNLPPVITLMLPNDHGSSERPHAGFPYQASYMADNDLAVGRAIEFLSRTPYWKNMAVFVTEDDPQGGVDHVDAHRSVMMVISPYSKKNFIGKKHYSFGSIFKTFWHILGIPYLNQYDASTTSMADLFTNTPDFSPYNAVAADPRIFDPQQALTPIDEKFDWKAFASSEELDKTETMQKRRKDDDKELKRSLKKSKKAKKKSE